MLGWLCPAWCTEDGNYFLLFVRELYKATINKQPSAGEKGCLFGLGDSLIYIARCTAHSVSPASGWTSLSLLHHEAGTHTTDFRVGWSVSRVAMPAIYSSTGLEKWLQIFRLQGHRHPIFYLLWVLFQMPCWTHLPALATDLQLRCESEALGNFWNFNKKNKKSVLPNPKAQVSVLWRLAP